MINRITGKAVINSLLAVTLISNVSLIFIYPETLEENALIYLWCVGLFPAFMSYALGFLTPGIITIYSTTVLIVLIAN